MKKRFYLRLVSIMFVLVLTVLCFQPPLTAVVAGADSSAVSGAQKIDYNHIPANDYGDEGFDVTDSVEYSDEFFKTDSYVFSYDLARFSMAAAFACFGTNTGDMEDSNISDLLLSAGYGYFQSELVRPEVNTIGTFIGRKNMTLDGSTYTTLLVAIRGGHYYSEWAGNFYMGESGEHAGFAIAADEVYNRIKNYISLECQGSKKLKILVCGYSRAAATANLVGKRLDEGVMNNTFFTGLPSGISLKPEDIYNYSFETPMGAVENPSTVYQGHKLTDNLFSFVNDADPVTKVAPAAFGFCRYGKTITLASLSPTDSEAQEMLEKFNLYFVCPLNDGSHVTYKIKDTQDAALNYLINALSGIIGSREAYCAKYQTFIMELMAQTKTNSLQKYKVRIFLNQNSSVPIDLEIQGHGYGACMIPIEKNVIMQVIASRVIATIVAISNFTQGNVDSTEDLVYHVRNMPIHSISVEGRLSNINLDKSTIASIVEAFCNTLTVMYGKSTADLVARALWVYLLSEEHESLADMLSAAFAPILQGHYPEVCNAWLYSFRKRITDSNAMIASRRIQIYSQNNGNYYKIMHYSSDGTPMGDFGGWGCGWFAFCHALQWIGLEEKDVESANDLPIRLYRETNIRSCNQMGTIANWLQGKYSDFRYSRSGDLVETLRNGGAAIINQYGHYYTAVGVSDDGQYVHIVDSCLRVPDYNGIPLYRYDSANKSFVRTTVKDCAVDQNVKWIVKTGNSGYYELFSTSYASLVNSGGEYWVKTSGVSSHILYYLHNAGNSVATYTPGEVSAIVTLTAPEIKISKVILNAKQTVQDSTLNDAKYVGIRLYDANDDLILEHKDEAYHNYNAGVTVRKIWYTIGSGQEIDYTLADNTTYKYEIFVVYGNEEFKSARDSFTTLDSTSNGLISTITLNEPEITSTYLRVSGFQTVEGGSLNDTTQVGIRIYDEDGELLKTYSENASTMASSAVKRDIWYTIGAGKEVDLPLEIAKKYRYELFAVVSGIVFTSNQEEVVYTAGISAEYTQLYVDNLTETSASVAYRCEVTGATTDKVSYIGIFLYNENGEEVFNIIDNNPSLSAAYTYFYNTRIPDTFYMLSPNTTYTARVISVVSGVDCVSDDLTFTTLVCEHEFGDWERYGDPTCTDLGCDLRKCVKCGTEEYRNVAPTGHKYEAVIISPTCTEQGYTVHTCSFCGDSYTDNAVEENGHSFEPPTFTWTNHKPSAVHICTECGLEEEIYAVTNSVVLLQPTLTSTGVIKRTATVLSDGITYTDSELAELPVLPSFVDINDDGICSILDVTTLLDYLSGSTESIDPGLANVNGDDDISIIDVTTLLDILSA